MIRGRALRDAIISAANNIQNNRQRVDALNVFPVPDGDTGTNMSMTMNAAKQELLALPDDIGIYEVAHAASAALLRGARGNSGVITSLLFRGFSKGLKGKQTADIADFVGALSIGVSSAYKAVMKPTEGTMLTVARVAAEEMQRLDLDGMSFADAWDAMLGFAQTTLEQTPEMLPVLKKAGVVDAGGEGLMCIYRGMKSVFDGQGIEPLADAPEAKSESGSEEAFMGDFDGEITYGYCTEFIVLKDKDHPRDPLSLRAYLESIGDSAVVVDDEDIIKCHVHTEDPGKAIQQALRFGMLSKIKVDNMRLQFADKMEQKKAKALNKVAVNPEIPYGFVAVAAGTGVEQLFADLGVDHVVSGGQTMNPSTEDILSAIEATPSRNVFVLPNNKNIIMAAEQAAKLSSDRKVTVIPTRTIPQGLGAMLAFDGERELGDNTIAMKNAADRVGTGQITFAARDSDYDGHKIKEGELLALENSKVAFVEHDLVKCAIRLTKQLLQKDTSFVTLIYGADITAEQSQELEAAVREKLPKDVDLALINGGQPVYYLIISVE